MDFLQRGPIKTFLSKFVLYNTDIKVRFQWSANLRAEPFFDLWRIRGVWPATSAIGPGCQTIIIIIVQVCFFELQWIKWV